MESERKQFDLICSHAVNSFVFFVFFLTSDNHCLAHERPQHYLIEGTEGCYINPHEPSGLRC